MKTEDIMSTNVKIFCLSPNWLSFKSKIPRYQIYLRAHCESKSTIKSNMRIHKKSLEDQVRTAFSVFIFHNTSTPYNKLIEIKLISINGLSVHNAL